MEKQNTEIESLMGLYRLNLLNEQGVIHLGKLLGFDTSKAEQEIEQREVIN